MKKRARKCNCGKIVSKVEFEQHGDQCKACHNEAEAIADDWDREMLGDDYLALTGHNIGNK